VVGNRLVKIAFIVRGVGATTVRLEGDNPLSWLSATSRIPGRAPGALGILGLSYGLAQRRDEANEVLKELLELDRRSYVTPAAVVNVL
jgi:hypothetical protein